MCGSDVPPAARACPECGACENSGWGADTASDGLDLPGEDFDYDQFIQEEFEGKPSRRISPVWVIAAVALLVALMAFSVLH